MTEQQAGAHEHPPLNYARASLADAQEAFHFTEQLTAEDRTVFVPFHDSAELAAIIADTDHELYLVTHGRRLVAMIAFEKRENGEVYIGPLIVHPNARGAGIAEAAIGEIMRRSRGTIFSLHVHKDNFRARHIYETLGFQYETGMPPVRAPFAPTRPEFYLMRKQPAS